MKNILFYLGIGFLFTHELDAMSNNEWLILPIINSLSSEVGELTFVLAHIPLFAVIVALISSSNKSVQLKSRIGLSLFLAVHGILHALFMGHDNYEFNSWLSNFLIFGGAFCGLSYLLLNRVQSST